MNTDDPMGCLAQLVEGHPLSGETSLKATCYIHELGVKPWVAYLLACALVDRATALRLTRQHECYDTILFKILDERQSWDAIYCAFTRRLGWHNAILKATKGQSRIQVAALEEYHRYDQYDFLLKRNRPKYKLNRGERHPASREPYVKGDFYSKSHRLPGSFGSRRKG